MNNNEIVFFDEYKKLDNLCKDILGADQGVTAYITEMENTSFSKKSMVASWDSTYKMLKHVKWVRNDIAHGNGDSECEQEDIDFVRDFYKKIMNQTDPFGIIHKSEKAVVHNPVPKNVYTQTPVQQKNYNNYKSSNYNSNDNSVKVIIGIFIVIIIAMILILTR